MLPFAHLLAGMLSGYYFIKKEKRNAFILLAAGFIGLLPDFDLIFRVLGIGEWHRGLSHSIFPMAVLIGIITFFAFRSFWFGFMPILSHIILDIIDRGPIAIFPGFPVNLPEQFYINLYRMFGYAGDFINTKSFAFREAQIYMTTAFGLVFLGILLLIEWKNARKK